MSERGRRRVPTGPYMMSKSTPGGMFTVYITSTGFNPEHENKEIPGKDLLELVQVLEGLAQGIRLMVDPDLQRKAPM